MTLTRGGEDGSLIAVPAFPHSSPEATHNPLTPLTWKGKNAPVIETDHLGNPGRVFRGEETRGLTLRPHSHHPRVPRIPGRLPESRAHRAKRGAKENLPAESHGDQLVFAAHQPLQDLRAVHSVVPPAEIVTDAKLILSADAAVMFTLPDKKAPLPGELMLTVGGVLSTVALIVAAALLLAASFAVAVSG